MLCMGAHCNAGGRAQPLYDHLRARLGDPVPAFMAHGPVYWETANCLSYCGAGPNCVLYPDDVWIHHADLPALKQFLDEHLGEGDEV